MKKIMFGIVVVAMALASEAASVSWQHAKVSTAKYNTVYLVKGTDYSAVIAALDAGGTTIANTMKGYDLINNGGISVQLGSKGNGTGTAQLGSSPAASDTYYYILVGTTSSGQAIANTMSYAASAAYTYQNFLDSKASVTGSDTPSPMEISGIFTAKTGTIGGGSPEPTPEPTSGLLLLLGVAGLALKRKHT